MSILEYILFVFIPAGIAYYLLIKYEIPKKWPRWCKTIVATVICVFFFYVLFRHLTQKEEGLIFVRIHPPQEAAKAKLRELDLGWMENYLPAGK